MDFFDNASMKLSMSSSSSLFRVIESILPNLEVVTLDVILLQTLFIAKKDLSTEAAEVATVLLSATSFTYSKKYEVRAGNPFSSKQLQFKN